MYYRLVGSILEVAIEAVANPFSRWGGGRQPIMFGNFHTKMEKIEEKMDRQECSQGSANVKQWRIQDFPEGALIHIVGVLTYYFVIFLLETT